MPLPAPKGATVGSSYRRAGLRADEDDGLGGPGIGADDKGGEKEDAGGGPAGKDPPIINVTVSQPKKENKVHTKSAEAAVNKHWNKFKKGRRGRPVSVLPFNPYSESATPQSYGTTRPIKATAGFDDAVRACKAKVEKISKECRRINQKYRDYHFDLEMDILWAPPEPDPDPFPPPLPKDDDPIVLLPRSARKKPKGPPPRYCLDGLEYNYAMSPKSVRRVEDIFEKPEFFKDGVGYNDVRQGHNGDCWFLAAVATVTCVPNLIERLCVARDEEVGIYGFVFYRDGEWISSIVDDQLYLTAYGYYDADKFQIYSNFKGLSKESVYEGALLRGSDALYFGSCVDSNETWLPLLEKAYAKAHGDYSAIEGGWTGEGVEDLTGGVTVEISTTDILSKDKFWKEQLTRVNKEFLFAGAFESGVSFWGSEKDGVIGNHAYSVLKAVEIDGERLVLVRNPWGESEWRGAWSDGSKEWTADWVRKLDHKFGDDGVFWMSYKDFLRIFTTIDRTRLFDDDWSVTNAWIRESVEWENTYSQSRFQIDVPEKCMVVIVLQQLDTRFFKGLEGEYSFSLHFRLHKVESDPSEYVVRSRANVGMTRSVSCECELEKGKYDVVFKIHAAKNGLKPVDQVVEQVSMEVRKKFLWLGMSYDLAHAKGAPPEKIENAPGEKVEKKDATTKDGKKVDEVATDKPAEKAADKKDDVKPAEDKKDDVKSEADKKPEEGKTEEKAEKKEEEKKSEPTTTDPKPAEETKADEKAADAKPTEKAAETPEKKPEGADAKDKKDEASGVEKSAEDTKSEDKKTADEAPKTEGTKLGEATEKKPEEGPVKTEDTDKKPDDATKAEKSEQTTQTQDGKADPEKKDTEGTKPEDADKTGEVGKPVEDPYVREMRELRDSILSKYPDWLLTVPAIDVLAMEYRLKAFAKRLRDLEMANDGNPPPTTPGGRPQRRPGDMSDDDEPIVIPGAGPPRPPGPPVLVDAYGRKPLPPLPRAIPGALLLDDDELEDELTAFENNCWNAMAVVGLRIYSYKQKVSIEVIRPKEEEADPKTAAALAKQDMVDDKGKPLQLSRRPTEKFKLKRKPTLAVPLDPDDAVEDVGKDQKKDESEIKDSKAADEDPNIKTMKRDDSFMVDKGKEKEEEKKGEGGKEEKKDDEKKKEEGGKEEKKDDEKKEEAKQQDEKEDEKEDEKKDEKKADEPKKDELKKDEEGKSDKSDDLNGEAVVV